MFALSLGLATLVVTAEDGSAAPAVTAPSPVPSVAPATQPRSAYERFIAGDYIFAPKVYNALSPGNTGTESFDTRAAAEFPLFGVPWMLEADFTSFRYPHDANSTGGCTLDDGSCARGIGRRGFSYVPRFQARDDDFAGTFDLKVADPRIYLGIGYLVRNTNYEGGTFEGPAQGFGGGIEKLPDIDQRFSIYGSVFYYPSVTTNSNQNVGNGALGAVQYRILKYRVGATFGLGGTPVFLDFGYLGDSENDKLNAPSNNAHQGPFAGLGVHF
jgi:hypothetical protein